jgi:hypothetical protein
MTIDVLGHPLVPNTRVMVVQHLLPWDEERFRLDLRNWYIIEVK